MDVNMPNIRTLDDLAVVLLKMVKDGGGLEQVKHLLGSNIKETELLDYDEFVDWMWFYRPDEHGGCPELSYTGNKLAGEAGEVCEKIGKAYRDNQGVIQDEDAFMKELGDVLFYIVRLSHSRGKTLNDVVKLNMAKLRDRKARGTLHGSGDNR
jgi:NTP pyrophosphatase (non-canonical NTP hydrolase)